MRRRTKDAPSWTALVTNPLAGAALALFVLGCGHSSPFVSHGSEGPSTVVEAEDIRLRLLLIGDAGENTPRSPVIQNLGRWASQAPDRTTVVFLGDNVYPEGLPDSTSRDRAAAEAALRVQTNLVRDAGASALFLPGNHDWGHGAPDGAHAIVRQERMIDAELGERGQLAPRGACPGPVALDLDGIRLIAIDTEWLLRPAGERGSCPVEPDAVFTELERLLATAGHRYVAILAHHPLETRGTHGGFHDWTDHVFPLRRLKKWAWLPLPGVGSLYPLARSLFRTSQDLRSGTYREMTDRMSALFRDRRPIFYAAGHDHSLQVIEGEVVDFMLVSGAGSAPRITPVSHGPRSLFAHSHAGFMVVDFLDDGRILLRVVEPATPEVVFETWMRNPG